MSIYIIPKYKNDIRHSPKGATLWQGPGHPPERTRLYGRGVSVANNDIKHNKVCTSYGVPAVFCP